MATLGKELMDLFYAENRRYLNEGDFELAFVYNMAETHVNNVKHGYYDQQWVPRFVSIMESLANDAESDGEKEHYLKCAKIAQDRLTELYPN